MTLATIVLLALVVANLIAFVAFGVDKLLAVECRRRIPEDTLLGLALIGGSAGAKIAQHLFRHKTRKEPFRSSLNAIVWLHAIAMAGGLALLFGPPEWSEHLKELVASV